VAHAGERTATLEEDMAAAREERKALPDLHIKILQMLAERDLVAVYWMASGTNTQEGLGFPATGRKISIPGMTIFRFQDGTMRLRSGRLRGSSLPLQR
jgi:predicted ester cyclase